MLSGLLNFPRLSRGLSFLRDARWLNSERAHVYSWLLAAGFAVLATLVWLKFAVLSPTGEPLGGDFVSFWAASKLVLSGHAADAWRPALHAAAEDSLFHGPHGYLAFFYPPPYLLACAPLALLPYGWAALVWMVLTAALGIWATRAALDRRVPVSALLAFPALWINIGCGQNGALSLAILSLGFWLMPRRPALAGLALGLMVIKPQLAVALPFALGGAALAQPRYWWTFLATGASAAGLCLLSGLAFGVTGWQAFLANSAYARATLDRGLVDPALMQSLFAALRVMHIAVAPAWIAQGFVSGAVLAGSAWLAWRYCLSGAALGALAVAATVLATPFLLDYDLLILALPLGWLVMQAAQGDKPGIGSFHAWEKLLLFGLYMLPLLTRHLAQDLRLPVAPFVLALLFLLVVRRVTGVRPAAVPAAITSPC